MEASENEVGKNGHEKCEENCEHTGTRKVLELVTEQQTVQDQTDDSDFKADTTPESTFAASASTAAPPTTLSSLLISSGPSQFSSIASSTALPAVRIGAVTTSTDATPAPTIAAEASTSAPAPVPSFLFISSGPSQFASTASSTALPAVKTGSQTAFTDATPSPTYEAAALTAAPARAPSSLLSSAGHSQFASTTSSTARPAVTIGSHTTSTVPHQQEANQADNSNIQGLWEEAAVPEASPVQLEQCTSEMETIGLMMHTGIV
ncbi:uncharacterized protein [Ambystoma mexicanum]|uniref:uncharacterized protein n=1 Tax=Ambystoma mexicanum TaxID=8296 RepID=UPI0037E945EF